MHNNVHHLSQYSGDIWQVFFLDFFLLAERCGLVLCEGFTVRLLRGVSVAHVVLVEGAAIRVPGEVFPDLFSRGCNTDVSPPGMTATLTFRLARRSFTASVK